jgi:hypothetical protein
MSSPQQNWRRRQNTFCLEVRRGWGEMAGLAGRGRNDPNNVFTYE